MLNSLKKVFIGQWKDEYGKILVIKNERGKYLTDFYTSDSNVVNRVWIGGVTVESINMKSFFNEEDLFVELGLEGIGPTLKLRHSNTNGEYLIPTVEIGRYDIDDHFGVPWVFPLSAYYKI